MDSEWVRRAQAGDHDAFAALAGAAISWMHRTARLILRDDDRASDAVQDALTTAWLDIRALREPASIDPWLRRLLVRACLRVAERERRERARRAATRVRALEPATTPDASRDVAMRDQVDRAFRRLAPDQRAVLVLRHYLDLSDAQAAAALGIPAGTVKSRLNRATVAFRAAIDADEREIGNPREVTA
jgi:RNA polymerase sigma factor (sigma-70 family)